MSRIHDALKKAQEERAAQQAAQGTGAKESDGNGHLSASSPAALLEAPDVATRESSELSYGPLTYETLLARCRQRRWNMDAQAIMFANGSGDVTGMESFRTLRARLYQLRAIQPV